MISNVNIVLLISFFQKFLVKNESFIYYLNKYNNAV